MNELNQAERILHSLAQLIALTSMQWLPSQADDSQTNMAWNAKANRLEGRAFMASGNALRLVIQADEFALHFMDNQGQSVASFFPESQTPDEANSWWNEQMRAWGIAEIRNLNYQLDAPVPLLTVYERPVGLTDWMYWRTIANSALQQLTEWSGRVSEIRVWPHHFDTGIYHAFTDTSGKERAAIWAGYAIADSICKEPYFYISGYASNQTIDFAKAPALPYGEWRSGADWKGGIFPVSAVEDTHSIPLFFQQAYSWLHLKTA